MPKLSASSHKRPRKLWWLVGLVVFALFAVLQMPAAWIVEKYAPESPYVQHYRAMSGKARLSGNYHKRVRR